MSTYSIYPFSMELTWFTPRFLADLVSMTFSPVNVVVNLTKISSETGRVKLGRKAFIRCPTLGSNYRFLLWSSKHQRVEYVIADRCLGYVSTRWDAIMSKKGTLWTQCPELWLHCESKHAKWELIGIHLLAVCGPTSNTVPSRDQGRLVILPFALPAAKGRPGASQFWISTNFQDRLLFWPFTLTQIRIRLHFDLNLRSVELHLF